jgi:hypothetical protein
MVDTIKEFQKTIEPIEVLIIFEPSWSTKWPSSPFVMEHPRVFLQLVMFKVKDELQKHILDKKITITIG